MANKKPKSKLDINIDAYIKHGIKYVVLIIAILSGLYFYFFVYNPFEAARKANAVKAFSIIQKQTTNLFKEQSYLFNDEKQREDKFCKDLAQRLSDGNYNCKTGIISEGGNFKIKKTKIEIYGLEKPAITEGDTFVKEFIIDVDGKKGENATGIDRFPLKVYSNGLMGGRLTPVNCSLEDKAKFAIPYSLSCGTGGMNVNFLTTNIPFGFNVIQIGGKDGKTKEILHNVPFLRADCAATGGDLLQSDYCEEKQIYWLSACYDDFPCGVELAIH